MSKRTRRQFLEDSMFAITAVAASGPILGSWTAQAQSRSPNERLVCAVIGVRSRGAITLYPS